MLTASAIDTAVRRGLEEDAPWGDLTSELLIPASAQAQASLSAREPGILSGSAVFAAAMTAKDSAVTVRFLIQEGAPFCRGDTLAQLSGAARSILCAERVALNFIQRMSAIATETSRYVEEVSGTHARIVDTRKTTPGLRALERHAVLCGGGHNHRYSLSDAVLAKDNHLAVLTAQGLSVPAALLELRSRLSHTTHLEVEVDRMEQIEPVLAAGIDTIMLDNFTIDELRAGVKLVAGRALVEASGNVSIETVRAIADTGVDIISVGALTHSVRAIDLGLDIDVTAP